jgi:hypothetical protein
MERTPSFVTSLLSPPSEGGDFFYLGVNEQEIKKAKKLQLQLCSILEINCIYSPKQPETPMAKPFYGCQTFYKEKLEG